MEAGFLRCSGWSSDVADPEDLLKERYSVDRKEKCLVSHFSASSGPSGLTFELLETQKGLSTLIQKIPPGMAILGYVLVILGQQSSTSNAKKHYLKTLNTVLSVLRLL